MKRNKVVSVEDAVRVVMDGDTVATSGFVGIGFPEELALALEGRFAGEAEVTPHGLASLKLDKEDGLSVTDGLER